MFHFIKPALPIIIIWVGLKITGQLGNVISFGQSAVLKTGVLNAGTELEADEQFNYNFNAVSLAGKPLLMDSLKNHVVFLNVWATWCGPCRAEMPTIQNLYDQVNNSRVVFIILSVDRNAEKKVMDYVAKNRFTFPVYILRGEPTEQLRVPVIPTTFVVSKKGRILRTEAGMRNYDTGKFRKFLLREARQ